MLSCSSGGSGSCQEVDPFRRQFFNTFNISRGLNQDFSVFIEWPTEQKGTYIFPISPISVQCPISTLWEDKWEHVFDWMADSPLSLLLCLEDSQCSCTYRISAAWRLAKMWRHRHEVIASKATSVRNSLSQSELIWIFSHLGNQTCLGTAMIWWPVPTPHHLTPLLDTEYRLSC